MTAYDLVVIGAGPGGYVCAIRAAQLGLKVAVVEMQSVLGGTCLNVGCIPSKALLESSERVQLVRSQLYDHGVIVDNWHLDLRAMMERKQRIVKQLTDGIAMLMRKNRIEVVAGQGRLVGQGKVQVTCTEGEKVLESRAVCLAMGSVAGQLPSVPFNGTDIVSSTEALSFSHVPKRLAVVGAGAVGLELATVWNRLGSKVTVVEMLPAITPFADGQMAKILHKYLVEQGLEIRLSTQVIAARRSGKERILTVQSDQESSEIVCDCVLIAVGRKARVDHAGLSEAGVQLDRGKVVINNRFETTLQGVYAIGDLVPGPMLAHKASEDGVAVAEIVADKLAGKSDNTARVIQASMIANVVYTEPELAQVGMTEAQLKEQKMPYKVGKYWYQANGRAKSLGLEQGLVKLLANKETNKLVGAHIVGARASELIGELAFAMRCHATISDIANTIHVHPSLGEMIKEAALAVDRKAIHA